MGKNRLEAFSDGVITIMMLELKPPHGAELTTLLPLWPGFMSYMLSFVYVGIYWNKPSMRVTHSGRGVQR